ncbi:MAG: TlpA family protein disulfide reductase [Prevotella sp.]
MTYVTNDIFIRMKRFLTLTIMTLAIMTAVTAQDADSKYAVELLRPGTEAPDFVIENAAADYNGTSLRALRGRYVVLDFWASWCPDCRKDISEMRSMSSDFASDKVTFVGISFDKDEAVWRKCVADSSLTWMQHSELKPWKETRISQDYHIKWIPSMYLIDPDGKVMLATVETEKLRKALESVARKE